MRVVLGIDAAWTPTEPSGVALIAEQGNDWKCIAIAPSYESFIALASGDLVDWMQTRFMESIPSAHDLLTAAQTLAGDSVDVVAVDMPIATVPITGRRAADSEISRRFGAMGCATHSPSIARPGPLGAFISNAFMVDGYEIAIATNEPHQQALIEVYPHTALLDLLQRSYRVKYKVAKAQRYWPSLSLVERIRMLLIELRTIRDALEHLFGSLNISLPLIPEVTCARHLKRCEDALDAAVCAWVGARFLQSTVIPFVILPRRSGVPKVRSGKVQSTQPNRVKGEFFSFPPHITIHAGQFIMTKKT